MAKEVKKPVKLASRKSVEKKRGKMVRAKVRAIADGQHKGRLVSAGEEFIYEGPLRDDKYFPLWVEAPKGYERPDSVVAEESEELKLGDVEVLDGASDVDEDHEAEAEFAGKESLVMPKAKNLSAQERFQKKKREEEAKAADKFV